MPHSDKVLPLRKSICHLATLVANSGLTVRLRGQVDGTGQLWERSGVIPQSTGHGGDSERLTRGIRSEFVSMGQGTTGLIAVQFLGRPACVMGYGAKMQGLWEYEPSF